MSRKLSEAQMWLVDYLRERWPRALITTEHQFCLGRKWRFDVAVANFVQWTPLHHAFEVEGGLFMAGTGRHNRGAGMRNDMEKYNTAAALGWKVFRFTPEQILKGEAKAFIEKYL